MLKSSRRALACLALLSLLIRPAHAEKLLCDDWGIATPVCFIVAVPLFVGAALLSTAYETLKPDSPEQKLEIALSQKDADSFARTLEKYPDLTARPEQANDILLRAVRLDDPKFAQIILAHGASADNQHSTALGRAANSQVAQLLLDHGAKPEDVELNGMRFRSTHDVNAPSRSAEVLRLILSKRTPLKPDNKDALAYMDYLGRTGEPESLQVLLDQGIDPEGACGDCSPLNNLLMACRFEGVGAKRNQACAERVRPVVADLIRRKVRVNVACRAGLRPMDIAIELKDQAMIDLLASAGAQATPPTGRASAQ